jgi:hypothetical protein
MSQFGFFSAWNAIYLSLALTIPKRRLFRGRILTMPIRRRVRWFAPPPTGGKVHGYRDGRGFRLRVIQLCLVCGLVIAGWVGCIVLFVDDWLTGGEDGWRRFKGWAGNRVKWLMELPAPPEPHAQ